MPYLVSVLVWAIVLSVIGWALGWLWYQKFFPSPQPMRGRPGAGGWTWVSVFLAAVGFWYVWTHNPLPFSVGQEWLAGAILGIILWLFFIFPVYKIAYIWNLSKTKKQFWADNSWWIAMFVIWGIILPFLF